MSIRTKLKLGEKLMLNKYLKEGMTLLIGNGINRYNYAKKYNFNDVSWEDILIRIANNYGYTIEDIPESFPYTEVFKIISINCKSEEAELKKEFVKELKNIENTKIHKYIVDYCRDKNIDILTSNFDLSLEKVYKYKAMSDVRLDKGFTDYYPWQRYYSNPNEPENHTKIWHIQGDSHYPRSIRLTVEDYVKQYEYFEKYDPLNRKSKYKKSITWLNQFFEKQVFIVGLALEEQEFFLRQILYKKKEYSKEKFIGYFVVFKEDNLLFDHITLEVTNKFKRLEYFANAVGLKILIIDRFSDFYEPSLPNENKRV